LVMAAREGDLIDLHVGHARGNAYLLGDGRATELRLAPGIDVQQPAAPMASSIGPICTSSTVDCEPMAVTMRRSPPSGSEVVQALQVSPDDGGPQGARPGSRTGNSEASMGSVSSTSCRAAGAATHSAGRKHRDRRPG
jgi:hypothetical protein